MIHGLQIAQSRLHSSPPTDHVALRLSLKRKKTSFNERIKERFRGRNSLRVENLGSKVFFFYPFIISPKESGQS